MNNGAPASHIAALAPTGLPSAFATLRPPQGPQGQRCPPLLAQCPRLLAPQQNQFLAQCEAWKYLPRPAEGGATTNGPAERTLLLGVVAEESRVGDPHGLFAFRQADHHGNLDLAR